MAAGRRKPRSQRIEAGQNVQTSLHVWRNAPVAARLVSQKMVWSVRRSYKLARFRRSS